MTVPFRRAFIVGRVLCLTGGNQGKELTVKIKRVSALHCTLQTAWDSLHNPVVFQQVSAPFLTFEPVSPRPFPLRYESKKTYVVKAKAFGFFPLGVQEINPLTVTDHDERTFMDNGKGLSGLLGAVTTFRHTMTLRPSGVGPTLLEDELEFQAGLLTPLLWLSFSAFWWWRHQKLRNLAPTWHSHTTAQWEERYRGKAVWSGKPNSTLVESVQGLTPGAALDVGTGEGADALWLASQGWTVTAVDASPSALMRAEKEREKISRADGLTRLIRWVASDAVTDDFPYNPQGFDLVVAHFLHMPKPDRLIVWKKMIKSVAPGGTLLVVGHRASDAKTGVRRPPAELMFEGSELRTLIPSSWSKVSVTSRERTITSGDAEHTVSDVVVRATR